MTFVGQGGLESQVLPMLDEYPAVVAMEAPAESDGG